MAPTAAIGVSGPILTTSSLDGDSLVMSAEFLERELAGPYEFTAAQVCVLWACEHSWSCVLSVELTLRHCSALLSTQPNSAHIAAPNHPRAG
jgi:hypothetical protein